MHHTSYAYFIKLFSYLGYMNSKQSPQKTTIFLLLFLVPMISIGQQSSRLKLDSITGDLNNDGISEKIIISQTLDSTSLGAKRRISLFKKEGVTWNLWKESENAILESEAGGMMGDPYQGIAIKKGVLNIYHFGGSRWKWSTTDKYRWDSNRFKLIGYTSIYGKPCAYWIQYDFNLVTGKFLFKREFEDCDSGFPVISRVEEEVFYKKNVEFDLSNRHLKEVKFTSPRYKEEIIIR